MLEALRASIEEAQPISSQELALDYIGKRSNQVGRRGLKGVGWPGQTGCAAWATWARSRRWPASASAPTRWMPPVWTGRPAK